MSLESMYEKACFEYRALESNGEDTSKMIKQIESLKNEIAPDRINEIDEDINNFFIGHFGPNDTMCKKSIRDAYKVYAKIKKRIGRQPK